MGRITVRVMPRSGRTAVEPGPEGPVVRVRAAPEAGRATEEAVRAIASAAGVAPSRVSLVRGSRSRVKTFEVAGRSDQELREALQGS